ncbi:gamma-glutamylcyclotransferase family protein [Parachlamydia sp.]|jgi:gamma-glutamylcyclotransferase (GGCT)/AIG2-like uncharacterized protein YtfP|uniref:Gamma-glutamylcyclotransferase AIG2-like domain-containing protein n=1 Tax=Parachlamydia acanthamoebae TaxID=83552 RepID=A0A0C1E9V5_9BACT|nr:hypothetical protein DB43_HG00140 [Parachlamydia acanthamoebae]
MKIIIYLITTFGCFLLHTQGNTVQLPPDLPHLYFAYGSNVSYDFLKERLKNGSWVDEWHKDGELEGKAPIDLGAYELNDYEFSYSLDTTPFGESGTAGNIAPKEGAKVYGAVYCLSDAQLAELDIGEDAPEAYARVAVKVQRCATQAFKNLQAPESLIVWAYVGNPKHVTQEENPDLEYVRRLVESAFERLFPSEYIDQYLDTYSYKLLEQAG